MSNYRLKAERHRKGKTDIKLLKVLLYNELQLGVKICHSHFMGEKSETRIAELCENDITVTSATPFCWV